jgi:bifunctional enzyme CysN/CysC
MNQPAITPDNIAAYLKQHQEKELCRFVTVGSVDDGKSTLIGRLLYDTHGIYEDQLESAKKASKQEGGEVDLSLFTDGLKAEREQGITIDVAYRYFSTDQRKFIIADTPGHVQYTRNMATGASTAIVAIILIDARLGILQQSRRHAYIASLLGIPHLCVCVNKMDLKAYSQEVFAAITRDFAAFCAPLRFREVKFIPVSAKLGDNVVHTSENTPWYDGGTILQYLETVPVDAGINRKNFRFPIQYVLRPHLDYRGFSGTLAAGSVKKGDQILTLPSRKLSTVVGIDTYDGELEEAHAPMAVTLRLSDEIDSSRGDMMVHPGDETLVLQRFDAKLVWLSEVALDRGTTYVIKHTTRSVRVDIESVHYLVDLESLEARPDRRLELNDIGHVTLSAHRPLFLDPYQTCGVTGAFILIDPVTNNTVAAGMVEGPAAESAAAVPLGHAHVPTSRVTAGERFQRLGGQHGATVWLTGLPAAGKSELGYEFERQLFDAGYFGLVVDPDDGRSRVAMPDGSTPPATPELARRLADAGLVAVFTYAMPLRADRATLREAVGTQRFVEVHVSTPLDACKTRDDRGAYGPHHRDPSYEAPERADLTVDLSTMSVPDAARTVLALLKARSFLP